VRHVEIVPMNGYSVRTNLSTNEWVKKQFRFRYLYNSTQVRKPFDGLDVMLLCSWVYQKFAGSENQRFVLHYWDLQLNNIMIDENENLISYKSFVLKANFKSIIDWDDIGAVPLKLSAISIAESFVTFGSGYKLDPEMDDLFRQELHRIEEENSGTTKWSQMFSYSRENVFLFDILRLGFDFISLRKNHPDYLAEALRRNPDTLSRAATEWKIFTQEKYFDYNLSVPNYPLFIEIQEALGLSGKSKLERLFRRIRRNTQKRWAVLVDKFKTWNKKRSSV
jgi:hypothetical protein